MNFESARALADAVLLEGYVLYPYRASAPKNHYRWLFGVLAPRAWSEAGGCEPWWLEAQCLVHGDGATRLAGRFRCLQVQQRQVERARDDGGAVFAPTDALDLPDRRLVSWDEGQVREAGFDLTLAEALARGGLVVPFELPEGRDHELVRDATGALVGRLARQRWTIRGRVCITAEALDAERPLVRLRVRVENVTPWDAPGAPRTAALRAACVSSHLLLGVAADGAFVSLLQPPAWAAEAARACRSVRTFPALAGEPGRDDLVLASPFALEDHAQIAPESPGDFCDAGEIDELLTLRTLTLTDEEKRDARGSDGRAAAILDRVEATPRPTLDQLHGAVRAAHDDVRTRRATFGAAAALPSAATPFVPGGRVRLRPGPRRTDAQDLLFVGCTATIERVLQDIDGRTCLAVTLDDDPAAELHRWYGRFHYYYPDEVEPLAPTTAAAEATR